MMRSRKSRALYKIITAQCCIKSIAESNLAYTISERKKINILREKLKDSINSTALMNPALASHYLKFYHSLSQNDQKMASLQLVQENTLLSEKIKIDRLTEMKDETYLLEERQYDDENNNDNIEQRILFNAVSRKFMSL
ncbi:hypothetical protein Q7M76_03410 [Candidatus Liberibacter asiaticus]|nr:hypothetical protein [Candidatus Liberibacter asiaticus]MCU7488706.1 hypothetical protein [Candidatus Liberibacter asiaticus]MCU7489741.1 hypothetical protein [Candidatus Liberibacter asiaticus]MDI1494212.1 hypothetical protein [Candidatus Liberibacter asiaticus]WCM57059.1 hypothetical protein NKF51_03410 [Candidatus Liberibacter asiaticus]WCM58086.1 hypothetical protein NLY32_03410 [Candidatus Liberibacter asiaticus]